jgi:hypothetical protein
LCRGQATVDLVPGCRDLNQLGDIARNHFLAHRRFESVPEYSMDRLDHPRGQPRLAALATRPRAAAAIFTLGIPSVLAALAFLPGPGDERLDILRGQLAQPLPAEAWY